MRNIEIFFNSFVETLMLLNVAEPDVVDLIPT